MIRASVPWDDGAGVIEWEDCRWMRAGRCLKEDPDIWFPDPRKHVDNEKAKSICAGCPVKLKCFDYAITHDIRYGVWGGFTEIERERLTGLPRKS